MNSKKLILILSLVIATCIAVIILLSFRVSYLNSSAQEVSEFESDESTQIRVVEKKYVPVTEYKFIQTPRVITNFWSDTVRITEVEIIRDTLIIYTDRDSLQYSTLFLTQFPDAEKLIDFKLSENSFVISTLNPMGSVHQNSYQLDLQKWNYAFVENHLTKEKRSFINKMDPFLSLQVRPFTSQVNLDLGIEFKTSNFNYEFGIGGFYSNFRNSNLLGADIFLKVDWRWLRR